VRLRYGEDYGGQVHEDVHEWEHWPGLRFPRKHSAGKYMSFIQYAAYIKVDAATGNFLLLLFESVPLNAVGGRQVCSMYF
jgi:hypothetical protein